MKPDSLARSYYCKNHHLIMICVCWRLEADFREKFQLGRGEQTESHGVLPWCHSIPSLFESWPDVESFMYEIIHQLSFSISGSAEAEDPMMPKITVEADLQELGWDVDGGNLAVGWMKFGLMMLRYAYFCFIVYESLNCVYCNLFDKLQGVLETSRKLR